MSDPEGFGLEVKTHQARAPRKSEWEPSAVSNYAPNAHTRTRKNNTSVSSKTRPDQGQRCTRSKSEEQGLDGVA
jgi:hypothetical protein